MHKGILLSFYSSAAGFVNGKCACFLPGFLGRAQKSGVEWRENPFRLLTAFAATFPKGTALVVAGNFSAAPKGVPLGELPNAVRLRGYFVRKKAPEGGCSPGKDVDMIRSWGS